MINTLKYKQINIVLIFFISAIFICCKSNIEKVNQITNTKNLPAFAVSDFETIISDSGMVKIKISAPELVRYEKIELSYDEYPEGIYVEFYNNQLEISSTLKCNYARYMVEKELWEVKSDVIVNNKEKKEKINTELMFWDIKKELIYSDKFVRVTTVDQILLGNGFESNQDFSKWKIINPTGTINIKNE